jgi:hypothetical protein
MLLLLQQPCQRLLQLLRIIRSCCILQEALNKSLFQARHSHFHRKHSSGKLLGN